MTSTPVTPVIQDPAIDDEFSEVYPTELELTKVRGLLSILINAQISAGDLVSVQPFSALLEGGLTELIGTNEQVDQNEYGGSVAVALAGTYSGEILNVTLYTTESGSGAVLTPAGTLFVFDADPTITNGDAAMTAAERVTVIGQISVSAADWKSDANGASVTVFDKPLSFHALGTLHFVWFHEDATSFNDAGGDDEVLQFNFHFRRDS